MDRTFIDMPATLLIAFLTVTVQRAQVPPETRQFDFWIGSWNAVGKMSAGPGKWQDTAGANKISHIMNGFTVQEEFTMGATRGSSWSVFDVPHKLWRQTWVDNSGSYIALSGKFEDGKMVLTTLPDPSRPKSVHRMTYSNITPEAFDWDWEGSRDGGTTWNLMWHLHYTRKKS